MAEVKLKSEYVTVSTEASTCPDCDSPVNLLIYRKLLPGIELPKFYICFTCGYVGQVGVGRVTHKKAGEV